MVSRWRNSTPVWTCANISKGWGDHLKSVLSSKWIKVPVFVLCLVPLTRLVWRGLNQQLGANPIEFITHTTGDWTLIFLVLTLTITPARKLLRRPELIRFRRMLGLDRKSTRLNSSHRCISYAVFC